MHVARLSQLGFFSALFFASEARWCANDKTGICEVNDLGGWCFHDKKTGEFTCDDESYCRNQSTLFGKINVAGCFTKEGNIRCCCNVGQLCNPQLVYQQPEIPSTSGQKCSYLQEDPREETVIYKDCQEKWCIAFMYNTEDKGSPVVINRGCESRFLLKHIQNKVMDDEFHNNTQWKKTDIAFKKPRCSEIVKESVPWLNDTQQQCLDFDYMSESGTKLKAKMCCCRGRDNCNAEFKWKDPAVTLSQIWTDGKTENASISVSIFTFTSMCVVFWGYVAAYLGLIG